MASAAWRAVVGAALPPARAQALAASLWPPRVLALERAVVLWPPLVLVQALAASPSKRPRAPVQALAVALMPRALALQRVVALMPRAQVLRLAFASTRALGLLLAFASTRALGLLPGPCLSEHCWLAAGGSTVWLRDRPLVPPSSSPAP